tara:strand:+ start:58 stop:798 length:741 start_codon:yes stop_codon:yes gene_type:complete
MKYVNKYKSTNYNSRKKSKIKLIIIHYTALKNTEEAISHLCNSEKKVSSHYLISQNGIIYNLVKDKFRAWHAGQSFWQGNTDINSISIGIELDYNPRGKNNKFSFKMMSSLKKLIINKQIKYKIDKNSILAHSDIAPFRKIDPGKNFPWKVLISSKIVSGFKKLTKSEIRIIEEWFNNYNFKSKKQLIIKGMSLIGYDTRGINNNRKLYNKLINAYRIRYLNNNYKKKSIYDSLISHLFNFMLTKK